MKKTSKKGRQSQQGTSADATTSADSNYAWVTGPPNDVILSDVRGFPTKVLDAATPDGRRAVVARVGRAKARCGGRVARSPGATWSREIMRRLEIGYTNRRTAKHLKVPSEPRR